MNIRIKFQKYGAMKFIGHLDVMRFFQKAIRRAGIDIAYSEGFSPHQIMSFAAPLGVGLTSDGEYLDISVNSADFGSEEIKRLNQAMTEGISILGYQKVPDMGKPSMSLVAAADYLVYIKKEYAVHELAEGQTGDAAELTVGQAGDADGLVEGQAGDGMASIFGNYEMLQEKVQAFFEGQGEILVTKKSKKSSTEIDLKNLIYKMEALQETASQEPSLQEIASQESGGMLFLRLCTGSSNNLKPELVLEAFCDFCGVSYDPFLFQIHRLEVYAKADDVPVKGEQACAEYQEYMENLKKSYAQKGRPFPEWFALAEIPYVT